MALLTAVDDLVRCVESVDGGDDEDVGAAAAAGGQESGTTVASLLQQQRLRDRALSVARRARDLCDDVALRRGAMHQAAREMFAAADGCSLRVLERLRALQAAGNASDEQRLRRAATSASHVEEALVALHPFPGCTQRAPACNEPDARR